MRTHIYTLMAPPLPITDAKPLTTTSNVVFSVLPKDTWAGKVGTKPEIFLSESLALYLSTTNNHILKIFLY